MLDFGFYNSKSLNDMLDCTGIRILKTGGGSDEVDGILSCYVPKLKRRKQNFPINDYFFPEELMNWFI